MKLKTTKTAIYSAVGAAARLINGKNAAPICDCVKIWQQEGYWWVTGGDMEKQATVAMSVTECSDPQDVCVDAAKLLQTLGALPEAEVTLETKDATVFIKCGKGKYKLPAYPTDDYPVIQPMTDENTTVCISGSVLVQSVKAAIGARAEDILRPQMSGVAVDVKGDHATIVGTDGHRMFTYATEAKKERGEDKVIILPGTIAKHIEPMFKAAGEVRIASDEKRILVWTDGLSIICPALEGRYPAYQRVIPDTNVCNTILCNVKDLIAALQRCNIFASDSSHLVAMGIKDGVMTLEAEDIDFNRGATEEIEVAQTDVRDGFRIGVHTMHFIDLLKNIKTQNVELKVSDVNRPIVMLEDRADNALLALIMPMLIQ